MLAQIASALGTQRLPSRKPFWATVSIIHRLLWLAPCVVPFLFPGRARSWPVIVIAAIAASNVLGQAGTSLWQSWMADLLPLGRAGRFWGVRQRALSISMVVSALGFGWILDRWSAAAHPLLGFQIVFAIAAVFGVSDIVTHCWVFEPAPSHGERGRSIAARLAVPFRIPGFIRFTVAVGFWTGACAMLGYNMGLPGFFSMAYLKNQFGATYSEAAIVFVAAGLGAALWTPLLGRWMDRWGARRVFLGLIATGPLGMLLWLGASGERIRGLPQAVLLLSFASLVLGGIYAGGWLCQVRYTQSLTGAEGRTVAMGLHWSIVGLIGSMGPLFAGWVKDHFVPLPALPGLTYYGLLVMVHLALAWGVAWPLIYSLASEQPLQESTQV